MAGDPRSSKTGSNEELLHGVMQKRTLSTHRLVKQAVARCCQRWEVCLWQGFDKRHTELHSERCQEMLSPSPPRAVPATPEHPLAPSHKLIQYVYSIKLNSTTVLWFSCKTCWKISITKSSTKLSYVKTL